jgi:hypothetical protein
MCCSPHRGPKAAVRLFARIGFGLSLAFVGFAHYQDPTFAEQVSRGLGVLESVGLIWGYILPAMMILGGLLLAFGVFMETAAYASVIALASIPAGSLLKSAIGGISLSDTMPAATNAVIWIIALILVVKKNSCGSSCAPGCGCGMDNCNCGTGMMPVAKTAPMKAPVTKSAPVMPVMTKAPAKKMPVKKTAPKKK